MGFLARLIGNGVGLWLATLLVGGISMVATNSTGQTVLAFAVVALVLTLVNAIVRPIVKLISLPFYLLTLGLFSLVVNALMLMLTGWISGFTSFGLTVDGFWAALLGGIIISVVSAIVEAILPDGRSTRGRDVERY